MSDIDHPSLIAFDSMGNFDKGELLVPVIKKFMNEIKSYQSAYVYNPWIDYDGNYDIGKNSPRIRSKQLEQYLRLRIPNAKYIFIAEALVIKGDIFLV